MSIRIMGLKCLAVLGLCLGTTAARGEDLSYVSSNDANFAARVEALEAELASLRGNTGSGGCATGNCNSGSCGCSQGGVIAGVELALLMPHTGSLRLPVGPVVFTPEYDVTASPRLWLGYRNDEGLGFRARYWTFDADAGPSNVGSFGNLHMETLDLEVTQVEQLANWTLDLSFGIRWGQDRNTLVVPPVLIGQQDFQGTGGTIALGAWRPVGCNGLSLFANARASLLYGQNDFLGAIAIPGGNGAIGPAVFQSEDEVVSVYELQIGVEWARQMENGNRWYLRTALECQAWNLPSPALGLLDDTTGMVGATIALGFNR